MLPLYNNKDFLCIYLFLNKKHKLLKIFNLRIVVHVSRMSYIYYVYL